MPSDSTGEFWNRFIGSGTRQSGTFVLSQRLHEVHPAASVVLDAEVPAVAIGVAGRGQDVVHADGVLDDLDDRLAVIRVERVALADQVTVDAPPGVGRAQELGQVGGVEGDEVAHLIALRLRDGHPLAGAHPPHPRVAGRNHELAGIGDHSRCPRLLRGFSSATVRRGVRPGRGLVVDWVVRSTGGSRRGGKPGCAPRGAG